MYTHGWIIEQGELDLWAQALGHKVGMLVILFFIPYMLQLHSVYLSYMAAYVTFSFYGFI